MATSPASGASALTFTFSAHSLRCIMRDGEPWFVAADVCAALGIGDTSKACSRLDEDERGTNTVRTPSGDQEMNIINESGLYSLILTSRKPEAKKYKKWVTSEVLPAIRKTGRYVASGASEATTTPAHVNERLNGADIQAIKRMIHNASRGFMFEGSWNQAIWYYLRLVLQLPSPQPFGVDHLPALGNELLRINAITAQVHEVMHEIEYAATKRIFRKGECAELVITDLRRLATERMASVQDENAKLPRWLQGDLVAITERKESGYWGHLANDEQPGYFEQVTTV